MPWIDVPQARLRFRPLLAGAGPGMLEDVEKVLLRSAPQRLLGLGSRQFLLLGVLSHGLLARSVERVSLLTR